MPVIERPDPYDNWERFKLPIHYRLLVWILTKDDRKQINKRIARINTIRRREHIESVEKMRTMMRPKPRISPPKGGTGEVSQVI